MEIEPPIKTKHTRTSGHHALFHCSIATKPQIIARLPVVIHSAVASGIVSWCVEFRRVTILQLGCSSTKRLWADRNGSFGRPNDINLITSRTISKSHATFMQSLYVMRKYRIIKKWTHGALISAILLEYTQLYNRYMFHR